MISQNQLFQFGDVCSYLESIIASSPRGYKTKLAGAMGCQAIYLIRALRGEALFNEEQSYRAAKFLQLSPDETDYFLDLVRLSRAADPELKNYLKIRLQKKSEEMQKVAHRIGAQELSSSLETQVQYYSSWQPSVLHLATSCPHLNSLEALSKRFSMPVSEIKKVMDFLVEVGLVTLQKKNYSFSGGSLHLPKSNPLQKVFRRGRREVVHRTLEFESANSLHFSSVFATSEKHREQIRSRLLKTIEQIHQELNHTDSEDIHIFAVDFSPVC